jgi:hypothetical protein
MARSDKCRSSKLTRRVLGATRFFAGEVKAEIPANNSSHLYLATDKALCMDIERGGIP